MKLKQIKIVNFGQFSNQTFDLPSGQIDVFFGANEAGKSTTVAFIKQILFGFHLRNNSSPFFEDYAPLAHVSPMGGSLIFENNGVSYELERLYAKGDKTKKGILTVKKNGQQVPESVFFDQIQNIDGAFYADSFIFNQEMLGQVSNLSQEKLLERIYYLGAANSNQLLSLREKFDKKANALFKKTGKKPEVNRLLKQLDDDQASLTETEAEFSDYQKLDQDLRRLQLDLRDKQHNLQKLQGKLQNLHDLQKEMQNYQTLLGLKKQSKELNFDSQNYQKAQDLMAQCRNLEQTIHSLQKQVEEFAEPQDISTAKKLIQQRSQLLQWQSEYRTCLQKNKQLNEEKEQLLGLSPELIKIGNLSSEQVHVLKQDYEALLETDVEEVVAQNHNQSIVCAILVVIGIILLALGVAKAVGIIAIIAGAGVFALDYQRNKKKHQQAVVLEQKQTQKRQAFQNKYGLDLQTLNLNDLLFNLSQYQSKEKAIQNNNADIKLLEQECTQAASRVQTELQKPVAADFNAILAGLDQLEEKIAQAQTKLQQKASYTATLTQDQQNLKELQLQLQAVFAAGNVKDMSEYDGVYQESLEQIKVQTQIETLTKNLSADLSTLKKAAAQPDELSRKMALLKQQIAQATDEISQLQQEAAQVQVKLNDLADSNTVFVAKQALANTQTQFVNASKEYLANLFAAQWISRALDLASNERFPKMLKAAKEYLSLLTGGRYVDLDLSKKLTVINNQGKKKDVKYLSRGTAEQLYFALKLAFVQQIKDKINLPILIDDSFVNFDDQRTVYIKDLLNQISQHNQVLIFTAQESLVEKLGLKPISFAKGA